jgi:hypothetical protein
LNQGVSIAKVIAVAAGGGLLAGAAISFFSNRTKDEQLEEILERSSTGAPSTKRDNFMKPDPKSLKGIPPYPNAAPRMMVRDPVVSGSKMAISWFETKDKPEDIQNFYVRAFADAGHLPVSDMFEDGTGYVGWMDNDGDGGLADGTLHMLTLVPRKGLTTVLVSSSRPAEMDVDRTPLPEGMFLPPSASVPQVITTGENMERQRIFWRSPQEAPELRAFLEKRYEEMGWSFVNRKTESQELVVAQKEGQAVTISIRKGERGGSEVVMSKEAVP